MTVWGRSSLVIAAGRCVAQLSLLSLILDSVFDWGNIWAVAAISLWLNIVGAWETVYNKSQQRVIWMFPIVLLALIASSTPICIAGSVAMQRNPIWNPKQYVPVLGLILGSIIATVSLSVSFVLKEFTLYRDRIQTKLAMGASRFEISLPVARSALKLALFPTINDMSHPRNDDGFSTRRYTDRSSCQTPDDSDVQFSSISPPFAHMSFLEVATDSSYYFLDSIPPPHVIRPQ
ncbi:Conserved hypothetical protein CHP00245 [Phaffia rhodozyma]|uniref:Transmembrane protein n=1 Tax=Phaffia rhodozyma TaxID=264483 RepID=A0A0F7ST09_PHARH|nr:Conserved hypothetical protein CHP00245 [Phaffia rhodozyma]